MEQEKNVGIQAFVHPELYGISGVFKQRFSDFIVREITPAEQVVYLGSIDGKELERSIFSPVVETVEPVTTKEVDSVPKSGKETAEAIIEEIVAAFPDPSSITEEEKSRCQQFIESHIAKLPDAPAEFVGFITNDKAVRSQFHQIVRKHAANFFETTSKPVDGNQNTKNNNFFLLITPKASSKSNNNCGAHVNNFTSRKQNKRKFDEWPKDCPDYLQFTVMKENIDTMNAVYLLSKHLKMKVDNIFYNGTKDKRAITTQKMTIYHRKPSDFNKMNSFRFPPYIRCGDFEYVHQPCKLGLLAGNRFELVIRKIPISTTYDRAHLLLSTIQKDGFINYFGLQRFGKGGSQSHILGKYLLQSNWSQCIQALFTSSIIDREDIKKGKEFFYQKDYQQAYQTLPTSMMSERFVLQSLMKYPEDYMNAFHKISKNIRLIYLHAYQSYLWNNVASQRVVKYGTNVIEGDLVLLSPSAVLEEVPIEELTGEELVPDEVVAVANEEQKEEDPTKMDVAETTTTPGKPSASNEKGNLNDNIHIVTAEDIATQRFKISDVILPLIGSDVLFPRNEFHAMYMDLLKADELSMDIFQKCLVIYRLKGGYRKLMEYPKDLVWELKEYFEDGEEINVTELKGFMQTTDKKKPEKEAVDETIVDAEDAKVVEEVAEKEATEVNPEKGVTQPKKALLLKFSLSPGSYATMFLREVTKESTEFDHQTFLMNKKET